MLSRRKVAEYVADALIANKPMKSLVEQLAAYLIEQKQADKVELLISDIEAALSERHAISAVQLTSARPLTTELRKSLVDFVRQSEQAKEVIVTQETVDADLIGGATVQTSNGFFDGSVRYQLRQLKSQGEV